MKPVHSYNKFVASFGNEHIHGTGGKKACKRLCPLCIEHIVGEFKVAERIGPESIISIQDIFRIIGSFHEIVIACDEILFVDECQFESVLELIHEVFDVLNRFEFIFEIDHGLFRQFVQRKIVLLPAKLFFDHLIE